MQWRTPINIFAEIKCIFVQFFLILENQKEESAEGIVDCSELDNNNTANEVAYSNEEFVEAVNNVAASSSCSEVVYALDSDGKEVAIGLLVSGPFEEVNGGNSTTNCQWIAAQEECGSGEAVPEIASTPMKQEPLDKKPSRKFSSVVKTYKKKNVSKKTLKQLKAQLDAARKKGDKKNFSGNSRGLAEGKKHHLARKKFVQKRITDKLYNPPSAIRKLPLPCNLKIFNNNKTLEVLNTLIVNYSKIFIFEYLYFLVKEASARKRREPGKYSIYWDMNIPTQFYKEEYLEFEKYLEFTKISNIPFPDNPHGKSEFCLQQFEMFEKFRRSEEAKYRKKMGKKFEDSKMEVVKKNEFMSKEIEEAKEFRKYESDSEANQDGVCILTHIKQKKNSNIFIFMMKYTK